jgi:hypothetical protein
MITHGNFKQFVSENEVTMVNGLGPTLLPNLLLYTVRYCHVDKENRYMTVLVCRGSQCEDYSQSFCGDTKNMGICK